MWGRSRVTLDAPCFCGDVEFRRKHSGDSTGEVSLTYLFTAPQQIAGMTAAGQERMAFLACRGGWPLATSMPDDIALDQAFDYVEAVEKRDIFLADGVNRDTERTHRLLRSYAHHQGVRCPDGAYCRRALCLSAT